MNHEAYISYDEKDQMTADAICHVLEENKIRCWLRNRDAGINDVYEASMDAISSSRLIVLIFSKNSKNSDFVKTEIDLAFNQEKPILAFKIDDSKLDGGLEFFLSRNHWLDAYPSPKREFKNLVDYSKKLLDKPKEKPIINVKAKNNLKVSKNKKIIIAVIAVVAYIAVIYMLTANPTYDTGSDDFTIILSNSSYIRLPATQFIKSDVGENGIFKYVDHENDATLLCCEANNTAGMANMAKLKDSIKTDSNTVNEDGTLLYEKDGTYSIIVDNPDEKIIIILEAKDKRSLIDSWKSLTFH